MQTELFSHRNHISSFFEDGYCELLSYTLIAIFNLTLKTDFLNLTLKTAVYTLRIAIMWHICCLPCVLEKLFCRKSETYCKF